MERKLTLITAILLFLSYPCFAQTVTSDETTTKASEATKAVPEEPSTAKTNDPTILQEIEVFLIDENASPVSQYSLPVDSKASKDLRFKSSLPNKKNYISWALELSDPVKNLYHRISSDGKVPETMHWDGIFDSGETIRPRGRYYYRLILASEDEKLYSSAWVSFSTTVRNRSEGVKTTEKYLNLYIAPTIGFESQSIKTKSFSDTGLALLGDLKFILNDKHTFALKYEATSDALLRTSALASDLNFSDFSFYYRYNLVGRPIKSDSSDPDRFVVQLGARGFASVVRGGGNLPVDKESARSYQGMTGTLNLEQRFGNFRLLEGAEAGYSLFLSKHTVMGFEGALSYEGFEYVGIGVHAHYMMVEGKPESDLNDGGNGGNTSISNKILMAGLSLYFKI